MSKYLETYFADFKRITDDFIENDQNKIRLNESVTILENTRLNNNTIYLIGNGGSSAIAEHMAIDFTKNAGLRAISFSGSPMLTTFSNDYGYEKVFQKAIESFADEGDVLIAISSSGTSMNILNACETARNKKMTIITFSAFESDNPLIKKGDLNFWVDSKAFGYVEIIHNLLIHYINDCIIGSAEYMIR